MFRSLARVLLGGALSALGCTNEPELPPELLEVLKNPPAREGGSATYPRGPYGTKVGDVAENLCFDAWQNPTASNHDPALFEQICFSDHYDPVGTNGVKALLVNTAAIWCLACRTEWCGSSSRPSLPEEVSSRAMKGLRVLGLLFQDAASNPAKPEHVAVWTSMCDIPVPFGRDEEFKMGLYANASVQPFNMVLDTRTMEIVVQVNGDLPDTLFAAIDPLLDAR